MGAVGAEVSSVAGGMQGTDWWVSGLAYWAVASVGLETEVPSLPYFLEPSVVFDDCNNFQPFLAYYLKILNSWAC